MTAGGDVATAVAAQPDGYIAGGLAGAVAAQAVADGERRRSSRQAASKGRAARLLKSREKAAAAAGDG